MKYAIYVSKDNEVIGPFTKKELREAVHSGTVSCDDWNWHKDLSEWKPVHAVIPIIHISCFGKEIAEFDDERDILNGLRDGTLLMNDYYWCEEMSEWKQLSTLEISTDALATTAQKDALRAAGLTFDELTTKAQVSALFSTRSDAPASAKQLALLRYLGVPFTEPLAMQAASELIDAAMDESRYQERLSQWNTEKLALYPDLYASEVASAKASRWSELYYWATDQTARDFLNRITQEEARQVVAHLDSNFPGWDRDPVERFYDYFVPALQRLYPKRVKRGYSFDFPGAKPAAGRLAKPTTKPRATGCLSMALLGILSIVTVYHLLHQ